MSIISRMRKQTAVWWPCSGTDAFGQPTYSSPQEISVRWEDKMEEFVDAHGTKHMSEALVYTDRKMTVRDVLLLGELDTNVDEANPKANAGAFEVKRAEDLPNLRNTEHLYTNYLNRR